MKLEDISAEIRPREPWEAVDLGCALVRRDYGKIMGAWAVTVLPLWVVLSLIFMFHPFWLLVMIWWLKPVYGRVVLFTISRALFGASPDIREVMRAWPKLAVRRLWHVLVLTRFSFSRHVSLPVDQLEEAKGKAFWQRNAVLGRFGSGAATGGTVLSILIQWVMLLSLSVFVFMMIPEGNKPDLRFFWDDYRSGNLQNAMVLGWVLVVLYMIQTSIWEPFYIGMGFGIYVNGRSRLEGWDIELTFRRLGERIQALTKSVAAVIVVFSLVFTTETQAETQEVALDPKSVVEEVKSDRAFEIRTITRKVPKEREGRNLPTLPFIGLLGKLIFWAVIVAAVGALIWLIVKNIDAFKPKGARTIDKEKPQVRTVMGMRIDSEALPDDIPRSAWAAWKAGDAQKAMRYLYCGAIGWMVEEERLPVLDSDTESDCLRHANQLSAADSITYFRSLTNAWVQMAYGKHTPNEDLVRSLCEQWPFSVTGGKG